MQMVAVIVFGPAQTIQWSTYFHFLYQDYRYSSSKAGRMIGFINLLMSLIGDLSIPLLTSLQSVYGTTFLQINLALAGAVILSGVLLIYHLRMERLGFTYEVGQRCCCFKKGTRTELSAENTITSGWG